MDTLLLVANWPSDVGYAWWLMESYWAELARHHKGRTVLAYPKVTTIPKAIAEAPLEVIEADFTANGKVANQCALIKRLGVQTVYLTDQAPCRLRNVCWRRAGVRRIVTHDHTPGLRTTATGWRRALKATRARLPGYTADIAIGATELVRRRLVEVSCLPEARTRVVPNGLPPVTVAPKDVRAEFGIHSDRVILVTTGRAAAIKNVPFALRCIKQIPEAHLLHIGDGPELEAWQGLAKQLGVEHRVTWAGKRSDVAALLPSCDIAIQPSKGEVGYSLSILEYMRAGLPVIVPDNPSVCGATTDGVDGRIYREDDTTDAVACLRELVASPTLRREMGRNGQQAVRHRFSLAEAHARLVEAVLGQPALEPATAA